MRRPLMALCLTTALGLGAAPAALAAGTAPVTPLAPTVVDECGLGSDRVTIPQVEGVRYVVTISGETIELTPGDYAGVAFWPEEAMSEESFEDLLSGDGTWSAPDAAATITAEAVDGSVLAEGATTSFDIALSSTPCASDHTPVTATATCDSVTFANPVGNPEVTVLWADADGLDDYTEVPLAPGASRTVRTGAAAVEWFTIEEIAWDEQDWAGAGAQQRTLAASTPDHVATEEDRTLLADVAEIIDELLAADLGGGVVELPADCDSDAGTHTGSGDDTDVTPVIPAVVQTDGGPLDSPKPLTPLGLLLAAAGAFGALRLRRHG